MKRRMAGFWRLSWAILLISQILVAVLFFNWTELPALVYLGWVVLGAGLVIGCAGILTLQRKGGMSGKHPFADTAILVESGIYAVARHPHYLSWILISVGIILLSQHWVVAVFGVAAAVSIFMLAHQDETALVERFGDDYTRYRESVPGMNLLLGVARVVRRRQR